MRSRNRRSELGRVIARRVLTNTDPGIGDVTVSIGAPRRHPKGNWECPFLIEGLGKAKIQGAAGADGLQALLLAVEGARVTLDKIGTGYTWLETDPDKAGTGIPRYIPMHMGPRFEARINLAIERESKRHYQTMLSSRKANVAAFEAEVKERREALAALEAALTRRKAQASQWEAELNKKSKPARRAQWRAQ